MSVQQHANPTTLASSPVSVIHNTVEPIFIKNRVFDATTDIGKIQTEQLLLYMSLYLSYTIYITTYIQTNRTEANTRR